jgi:hypothetical protein
MIQVLKNTASSTQSRQIMSGYERFDRWIQLRSKNVHVRGEESKLITLDIDSGLAAWDSSAPFMLDFSEYG